MANARLRRLDRLKELGFGALVHAELRVASRLQRLLGRAPRRRQHVLLDYGHCVGPVAEPALPQCCQLGGAWTRNRCIVFRETTLLQVQLRHSISTRSFVILRRCARSLRRNNVEFTIVYLKCERTLGWFLLNWVVSAVCKILL